jgi:hypothetical protein
MGLELRSMVLVSLARYMYNSAVLYVNSRIYQTGFKVRRPLLAVATTVSCRIFLQHHRYEVSLPYIRGH